MINEAKRCLSEGVVASEDDIDVGHDFRHGLPAISRRAGQVRARLGEVVRMANGI